VNTIKAIIVDDEINARENLRYLTNTFCEKIEIVYEASNVDDAISAIEQYKPHLVFLDIEMPQKNGFQLINHFTKIDFYIIFVTAYDKYAIKAFKYSALDYLMKPIDIQELKDAVKKASKNIEKDHFKERLELLNINKKKLQKIALPYKSDYVILDVNNITCIEADRMYAHINTLDNKTYTASKKLSHFENLLSDQMKFIRVHRSWLINTDFINIYSKKEKFVQLTNGNKIPVSKSYKEVFENLFSTSKN